MRVWSVFLWLPLAAGLGDAKVGDAKVGDAKVGDAKVGDAKVGDAKVGDAKVAVEAKGDARRPVVIALLPEPLAAALPAGKLTQEQGEARLRLMLVDGTKVGPPILGEYVRKERTLTFVPRFPLVPEKSYQAQLVLPDAKPLTAKYEVPAPPAAPPAEIVKVYPSGDVLPANQLRFYIYFSRPMRGGPDIFKQIRLLDEKGEEISDPWLPDELWDDEGKLLILYIHPGRIKWGVVLRWLLGPVLEENKNYRLTISPEMLDADGRGLGKEYVKKFRTTAEDRTRLSAADWKVRPPAAGTSAPLVVEVGKSLDHLGLEKYLEVTNAKGERVAGKIKVGPQERSWHFTPDKAWKAEDYTIKIGKQLEDVAGNNPLRAFDVDRDAAPLPAPKLELQFRPLKKT